MKSYWNSGLFFCFKYCQNRLKYQSKYAFNLLQKNLKWGIIWEYLLVSLTLIILLFCDMARLSRMRSPTHRALTPSAYNGCTLTPYTLLALLIISLLLLFFLLLSAHPRCYYYYIIIIMTVIAPSRPCSICRPIVLWTKKGDTNDQ